MAYYKLTAFTAWLTNLGRLALLTACAAQVAPTRLSPTAGCFSSAQETLHA